MVRLTNSSHLPDIDLDGHIEIQNSVETGWRTAPTSVRLPVGCGYESVYGIAGGSDRKAGRLWQG